MNVAPELGAAVAAGLGMREMPEPMPKVLEEDVTPEVAESPALSLFARPGNGSVQARRVAILVADGVDGDTLRSLAGRLMAAGAVPRFVGSRLGAATSLTSDPIEVDVTMEAMPSVLFDAVVLPDGADAVQRLALDARTLEFLKDQYRHCKPILVLGAAVDLLDRASIPHTLPSGEPDPGLVLAGADNSGSVAEAFLTALARHRHFERETDPPLV
jgi:catalase